MIFRHPSAAFFLLLLFGLASVPARAASSCTDSSSALTIGKSSIKHLKPTSVRPVGSELDGDWSTSSLDQYISCRQDTILKLVLVRDTDLAPGNGPGRYQTGIPGTELEIGVSYGLDTKIAMHAGSELSIPGTNRSMPVPRTIVARLIRTDSYVARTGEIANLHYQAELRDNDKTFITYKLDIAKLTFEQNVILMSCTTDGDKSQVVPMGRAAISAVRADTSPVRDYALNVTCEGTPAGSPPPVRVYFEGDATPDGVLRLSELPETATGIGIAVTSTSGAPLPFANRAQALGMTWVERKNGKDRYRFEGRARYVAMPGAGPPKPGRADAVMSYVLDYN